MVPQDRRSISGRQRSRRFQTLWIVFVQARQDRLEPASLTTFRESLSSRNPTNFTRRPRRLPGLGRRPRSHPERSPLPIRSLPHVKEVFVAHRIDYRTRRVVLYDDSNWVVANYDLNRCRDWEWERDRVYV